jgi:hypothetical protein
MVKNGINFNNIKWGSFTKQFQNRKNKNLMSLKSFSNFILKHPKKFNKKTLKRANFYKHVIIGGMLKGDNDIKTAEEWIQDFPEFFESGMDIFQLRDLLNNRRIEDEESEHDEKSSQHSSKHDSIPSLESSIPESIYNSPVRNYLERGRELSQMKHNDFNALNYDNKDEETNPITTENFSHILSTKEKGEYLKNKIKNKKKHEIMALMKLGKLSFKPEEKIDFSALKLLWDSRNPENAVQYLSEIYEEGFDFKIPSLSKEKKIFKEARDSGKAFEFTSCGKNNKLFSKICNVENNNVQLSDFWIDALFDTTISILKDVLKENLEDFDESELEKLTSAGSQFPHDLLDFENEIVNERKDFRDVNFIEPYLKDIKKMKEVFLKEYMKYKWRNIDEFKIWYYKNYEYNSKGITIAKFPYIEDNKNDDWCNSESDINFAFKRSNPRYRTIIDSKRHIILYEKYARLTRIKNGEEVELKPKNEREKYIIETFFNIFNDILKEEFKGKKMKWIITFGSSDCIANYNFTNDNKIKKGQILSIYKLSSNKKEVEIPLTEFEIIGSKSSNLKFDKKEFLKLKNSFKEPHMKKLESEKHLYDEYNELINDEKEIKELEERILYLQELKWTENREKEYKEKKKRLKKLYKKHNIENII